MTKNGLRARLTLAVFALSAAGLLLPGGCGSNDFLGLEDYQRDILVWLLRDGQAGGTGLQCWDLDGDGVADPSEDTNGDGVVNERDCDGLSCWDLNGNGARDPDEDTNGDGNVDTGDCRGELCRVQLVFVLDTSGSMDDQAAAVCTALEAPIAGDGTEFVVVGTQVLAIRTDLPPPPDPTDYTCLMPEGGPPFDSVLSVLGADPLLLDDDEDWGLATQLVAEGFPWPDEALRVVVPIVDEDPQHDRAAEEAGVCSMCEDPGSDRVAIDATIAAAAANGVVVYPILGTLPPDPDPGDCPDGRDQAEHNACIPRLAQDLASDSVLREFVGVDPPDLQAMIRDIINSACADGS